MKALLIINALIWAGVILVSSYFYNHSKDFQSLLWVMLIGFILQNGFTYNLLKKKRTK